MSKTDVKKIESEDLRELSDESLDRAENTLMCLGVSAASFSSPSD